MIDPKEHLAIRIVIGCALAAYVAGEHLEFSKAPATQTLTLATTSSTSNASVVMLNPTTFSKVDPPPPVVPPGDRQEQG